MRFRRTSHIKTNYPVIGVKLIQRAKRFMAEIGNFELKPVLGFWQRLNGEVEFFLKPFRRGVLPILQLQKTVASWFVSFGDAGLLPSP
jgi:hypothetical protein